ncbi:MAG TPA: HAD domain-containing protein [Burkholderiaceae bacterium]|nr:HAD domain-containing protein [Burkholderiaceae bacterium]
MILFLDFDGVLHPDPCMEPRRLFEHAPRLAQTLSGFAEVEIVLSTAWRNLMSFDQLQALLPEEVAARVIGITPTFGQFDAATPLVPYRRQAECAHWLRMNNRPPDAWVALDDRPHWFSPYCENLIDCNSAIGLEPVVAARLTGALVTARARHARASRGAATARDGFTVPAVLPKTDAAPI